MFRLNSLRLSLFSPGPKENTDRPQAHLMYVGRAAVEKSIEDFLNLDIAGTKYVAGDGPDLSRLKAEYPKARFAGYKSGEELADYYAPPTCSYFRAGPIPSVS